MFVQPVRRRQDFAELALVFGAETQPRRNEVAYYLAIESIAGNADAVSADDRAWRFSRARRLQLNQRKIARPATEIGNQHELLVIEPLLVLVGGGDGLREKVDVRETSVGKGDP